MTDVILITPASCFLRDSLTGQKGNTIRLCGVIRYKTDRRLLVLGTDAPRRMENREPPPLSLASVEGIGAVRAECVSGQRADVEGDHVRRQAKVCFCLRAAVCRLA